MDVGIDFLIKSLLIDISKHYSDYMSINDKKNITVIREYIISDHFMESGFFIEYVYYYIKDEIFGRFEKDEEKFKNKFKNNMKYLNMVTLIFAIFSFIYVVIFVFITITNFGEPIKRSAFRISCSFYFIRRYNIFNYKKSSSH